MIDLRQAGVDDAAELSRIQVDSWQAYESIFSPAYMAQHNTYIRTAETGKGYGSYVLRRLFTSVKTAGYDRITLWVLKDNRRAIAFYRHFGFTPDGFEMSLPIQGPILETRMSREL